MATTKKIVRLKDVKIVNYVENESSRRKISQSSFINECIEKCMEGKNFKDDFSIKLDQLNKDLKKATKSFETFEEQIKYIYEDSFCSKYLSLAAAVASLILLEGKINEYEIKNVDWKNIFTRDYRVLNRIHDIKNYDFHAIMKAVLNETNGGE